MPVTLTHLEHQAAEGKQHPPLLIAHGLFGSARNFNSLGRRLATTRRVVMVDMRNHGASPWDPDNSYPAMADDLAEAVTRLCGGRAVVLGHSMGGKAAMTLALSRPQLLAGLIVADIAPVPHEHSHLNYIKAMQAVDLARVTRRSDADPMLSGVIPEPMLRSFLLQNLVVEGGRASWRPRGRGRPRKLAPQPRRARGQHGPPARLPHRPARGSLRGPRLLPPRRRLALCRARDPPPHPRPIPRRRDRGAARRGALAPRGATGGVSGQGGGVVAGGVGRGSPRHTGIQREWRGEPRPTGFHA